MSETQKPESRCKHCNADLNDVVGEAFFRHVMGHCRKRKRNWNPILFSGSYLLYAACIAIVCSLPVADALFCFLALQALTMLIALLAVFRPFSK